MQGLASDAAQLGWLGVLEIRGNELYRSAFMLRNDDYLLFFEGWACL